MTSDVLAEEIAEDLLYRTGKTLRTGELHWVEGFFKLPQLMETVEGTYLLETEEDVRRVFRNVLAYYRSIDVTNIARTVVWAEFLDSKTIGTIHASRLMKTDGQCIRAPYPVYSVLRKFGDDWKIISTSYAILDSPAHNHAMTGQLHAVAETPKDDAA